MNERVWISKTSLERFVDRRSGSVELQNCEPGPEYRQYWDEYRLVLCGPQETVLSKGQPLDRQNPVSEVQGLSRKAIIEILVHELWVQNLSHFGTLETNYYYKDAEYLYNNLIRAGVLKEPPTDDST